jgi:hypothetical protein
MTIRNEPLDCEVYANAAEQIYRPNYEKLAEQFAIREQQTPEPDPNPDRNLPAARADEPDRLQVDGWIPQDLNRHRALLCATMRYGEPLSILARMWGKRSIGFFAPPTSSTAGRCGVLSRARGICRR